MKTPVFWNEHGIAARLLNPASVLFGAVGRWRWRRVTPVSENIPILCVGNLVAGGAGKTPVALSLASRLRASGYATHFLSRGYGGAVRGPHRVDNDCDGPANVGDEALLLAAVSPTWVSRNRVDGARAAALAGAEVIVMDDGFQNPSLLKDLSVVVIDGAYGFGNQRLIPAGPLRESDVDGPRGRCGNFGGLSSWRARANSRTPAGPDGATCCRAGAFKTCRSPRRCFCWD